MPLPGVNMLFLQPPEIDGHFQKEIRQRTGEDEQVEQKKREPGDRQTDCRPPSHRRHDGQGDHRAKLRFVKQQPGKNSGGQGMTVSPEGDDAGQYQQGEERVLGMNQCLYRRKAGRHEQDDQRTVRQNTRRSMGYQPMF